MIPGAALRAAAVAVVAAAAAAAGIPRGRPAATPGARSDSALVTVEGPAEDTLRSVTPTFIVTTSGFPAGDEPLELRLQIGRDAAFGAPFVDTTLAADTSGSTTITIRTPLPQRSTIFWRALARSFGGPVVSSAVSDLHHTGPWLTLLTPNAPNGTTIADTRPEFVWSSPEVVTPPGPWVYSIDIISAATGQVVLTARELTDTVYRPPFDLEPNAPYRWAVTARLGADSTRVSSRATFVIVGSGAPLTTLLFQNFPNPFPSGSSAVTCIWFDLRRASRVRLLIVDLRGHLVRTLIPSPDVGDLLPPGRYGRAVSTSGSEGAGCDPRFSWDGTAEDGRVAPPGVYLLRLYADGGVSTRKVLFRGR